MQEEIGGEFPLSINYLFKAKTNKYLKSLPRDRNCFLTSSGRDSLSLIIKMSGMDKNDEVLFPAYLCESVLLPFKENGIGIKFYKINPDLTINIDDIKSKITPKTKGLLIIHYFGFPQPDKEKLKKLCNERSIFLIEDLVQSFLTADDGQRLGYLGDFSFNSYRKFLPVPDGSLLSANKKYAILPGNWKKGSLKNFSYVYLRLLAMNLKDAYLKTHLIPKRLFLNIFHLADNLIDSRPKPSGISRISKKILQTFDFGEIIQRRRKNFQYLLEKLDGSESIKLLFSRLPEGVCPLGFPILVQNRNSLKDKLIKSKIYPPIHWKLPKEIDGNEFANSRQISENILTLPIDQRYGLEEMKRIADIIKNSQL